MKVTEQKKGSKKRNFSSPKIEQYTQKKGNILIWLVFEKLNAINACVPSLLFGGYNFHNQQRTT
jgi:hypothetical protein